MAQQRRMVYAKTFSSHTLNSLPVEARYLYVGMIVVADDDGRLNGDPRYLKGQVFSYDDEVTSDMVKEWRDLLATHGQIDLYRVENTEYISHPNWKEYQSIRSDMYVPSRIPKPKRNRTEPVTESVHKLNQVKLNQVNQLSNGEGTGPPDPPPESPKDKTIKFLKMVSESGDELELFIGEFTKKTGLTAEYAKAEVKKFWRYWTERTPNGKKEKWQLHKTFEIDRRLTTWFNNQKKWSNSPNGNKKERTIA